MNKICPNLEIFKIYVTWLWQRISVENSSPPPCVIHIRKHLDLHFHLVYAELVFWYENHKHIAFWKEMQISGKISLFWPQSHCKWSDIKILSLLIQFFVWIYIVGPIYKGIYKESVSFSLEMTLLISASSRTQPGPQSDISSYAVEHHHVKSSCRS